MGVEMNKATVRRLQEDVWNQQNLDAVSEVFAAEGHSRVAGAWNLA
jgi:hypothetical protein